MDADSAAGTAGRKHDPRLNNLLLQFSGLVDVGHRWSALSSRLMWNRGIYLSQAECTELELLHNRWNAYIQAIAAPTTLPPTPTQEHLDMTEAATNNYKTNDSLPTVEPWKGKNYRKGGRLGAKVLFVGKAMFSVTGQERIKDAVNLDVQRYVFGGERRAFFTTLANIVLNRSGGYLDHESMCEAWDEIAFTNYIQAFVGDDHGLPVEPSLWRRSENAFHEVLEQLQPDLVVVRGKELSERLPAALKVERVTIPYFADSASRNGAVQAALTRVQT